MARACGPLAAELGGKRIDALERHENGETRHRDARSDAEPARRATPSRQAAYRARNDAPARS
ncbi:hypothetical protein EYA88_17055 [Burkholderia pseudomallei]|nr:hypothetical protein EYA88_17055 [Burkholderia pseudomallei]